MRGLDDYYSDDSDAFPDAEELAERVEQLEARIEAARWLHTAEYTAIGPIGPAGLPVRVSCKECGPGWPCATAKALDGDA